MMERKNAEFKREYVENIKYTTVAFANTDGGKIYIGINDDGSVQGVENADAVMLRVTNMIQDTIHPNVTMFTECGEENIDGKPVVVLTVRRGTARPYYLAGKGIRPEGVYLRQGASSVPASQTAILNMIKETSGDCYEDARSLNQQLTFRKAEDYFARHELPFGESQKRTMGIIGEDGTYTNLGLLLSDECVHTIKLAAFDGSKKTTFRDRQELGGSLLEQLEKAYDYIDQFNRIRSELAGVDRIEKRDYPPEAVREALLNAIIHRDYNFSDSTIISIFDNRIEFVTIGGPVRGLTKNDILLGVSMPRNKKLANAFYRLQLTEACGTGLPRMNACYADSDEKPLLEVAENTFKITLPNRNFIGKGKEMAPAVLTKTMDKARRQDIIYHLAQKQGSVTRKDVENVLQMSQSMAILILREMVDKGLLVKDGAGKQLKYHATTE